MLSSSSTPPIRTSQYDVLSLCFRRLHFFCRLHIKTKSAWWFLKNMRSSVGIILPNRWKNKIHVSNHQPEISWASAVSFLGWLIVLHRIWGSVGLNRTAFCLMEEISNELDGVRNPDTKNHWETPWDHPLVNLGRHRFRTCLFYSKHVQKNCKHVHGQCTFTVFFQMYTLDV